MWLLSRRTEPGEFLANPKSQIPPPNPKFSRSRTTETRRHRDLQNFVPSAPSWFVLLGFGVWDLGFGIYCCVQVIPPSAVENVRLSIVTTVADRGSVALILDKSTGTGKVTRCQVWRSVERSTVPARPTIQQTSPDGDDPAVIWAATSEGGAGHIGPQGLLANASRACSCPTMASCRSVCSRRSAAAVGAGAAARTDSVSLTLPAACFVASFSDGGGVAGGVAAASADRARSRSAGVAALGGGTAGVASAGASFFSNVDAGDEFTATLVERGTATQIATAVAAAAAGTAQASHHFGPRSGSGAGAAARVRPIAPTSAWQRAHPATCDRTSSSAALERPSSNHAASVSASRQFTCVLSP